ncbi:MAG TPA: prepilin-type N-terminal cleavage/methylation domain-containing protein [Tepidisphaeraceae bacterium]|jgi:prepilin-type N-terminal cleavage/methylation domain-containing protein
MRGRRGFTLIEASLTIIIIGVGVLSMLELTATGTRAHGDAMQRTTGLAVAQCLHERTIGWTFDQLRGHAGETFAPPVDAEGVSMPAFGDWQQVLEIQAVEPDNLSATSAATTPSAVRVTVHAVKDGLKRQSLTWYRFASVE